jgi:hypothetical protein
MDNGRALLAGAVVVGAVVWWLAGHPGYETGEQRQARIAELDRRDGFAGADGSGTAKGPTLYRCPGADGVNTITDSPPPGRKCTVVSIRDDQNVVSLQVEAPQAPAKKQDKKR